MNIFLIILIIILIKFETRVFNLIVTLQILCVNVFTSAFIRDKFLLINLKARLFDIPFYVMGKFLITYNKLYFLIYLALSHLNYYFFYIIPGVYLNRGPFQLSKLTSIIESIYPFSNSLISIYTRSLVISNFLLVLILGIKFLKLIIIFSLIISFITAYSTMPRKARRHYPRIKNFIAKQKEKLKNLTLKSVLKSFLKKILKTSLFIFIAWIYIGGGLNY